MPRGREHGEQRGLPVQERVRAVVNRGDVRPEDNRLRRVFDHRRLCDLRWVGIWSDLPHLQSLVEQGQAGPEGLHRLVPRGREHGEQRGLPVQERVRAVVNRGDVRPEDIL